MSEPIVGTVAGPIRGEQGPHGLVFKGVPYAAPPTGPRRFRPPAPLTPWSEPLDCTRYGTASIPVSVGDPDAMPDMGQGEAGAAGAVAQAPTGEDCLYLNVWTPAADDARRPTMVWIHGGGFSTGSGSDPALPGDAFARDGVVLVSLNYRLHAFGFLYLDEHFPDARGSGNHGILDQIAALEWVRDNIAAFGGDPDNVTIFGESAGGMSVGTLLATPRARGLFRRAIAESGAGHHNLPAAVASQVTTRVLSLLDVAPGDWDALLELPVERIVQAATRIGQGEALDILPPDTPGVVMGFQPVIDGTIREGRAVDLVAAGSGAGVDLLVGSCADEWQMMLAAAAGGGDAAQEYFPDVDRIFAASGRTADEVLKTYAANRPDVAEWQLYAAIETDHSFWIPAVRLAEAQLAHHPSVWMFRFSWDAPAFGGILGAYHTLELPFVFDALELNPGQVGDDAPQGLADAVHGAWIRFASNGDPGWARYDLSTRPVMDFDSTSSVVDDPYGTERALWDGVR